LPPWTTDARRLAKKRTSVDVVKYLIFIALPLNFRHSKLTYGTS